LYIIPYIGITISAVFPALSALVLIAVNQLIENNIVIPYTLAGHVHINPLFAMVACIVGGHLWDVTGMIVLLPVLHIITGICDYVSSLQPYRYVVGADHTT